MAVDHDSREVSFFITTRYSLRGAGAYMCEERSGRKANPPGDEASAWDSSCPSWTQPS